MEKKIYTSNFARKGSDPKALAISAWPPPWYEGKGLSIVAPTRQMVLAAINKTMDMDTYWETYINLLDERIKDPYKLIEDIPDGTYLLCYEKSSEPCHRHLLRDWVYDKIGYRIEEWKNDKEQKEADQQGIVDDLLEL